VPQALPKMLKVLVLTAAAAAFALLAGFVIFAASVTHYGRDAAEQRGGMTGADAIVVLTGGEQRIGEGLRLFGVGGARRLLISGVNRATTREDIRRASTLPGTLFDCCIDIGYAAKDTFGNATEARDWAAAWGFSRLVVVTSAYHMPRSLAELARTLPGVDLHPRAVASRNWRSEAWWLHAGTLRIITSEYLKFIPAAVRYAATRLLEGDHRASGTPIAKIPPGRPGDAADQRRAAEPPARGRQLSRL
jgi:uncharacterized SAM-binding protein YcdF (DUF218 family)